MENLNAEQIKKALECCTSGYCYIGEGCPLDGDDDMAKCTSTLSKNALALIESQEKLVEDYRQELAEVRVALAELRAELEQRPPKLIITKLPKKENENV